MKSIVTSSYGYVGGGSGANGLYGLCLAGVDFL
jgi:hypothetical protein